jgi:hypothetical protein
VRRGLAVLVLAIALTSACDATPHLVVHPDGSGTFSMVITDTSGPAGASGGPAGGDTLFSELKAVASLSGGSMSVDRVTGAQPGARLTYNFLSLDDLRAELTRLQDLSVLGGVGGAGGSAITLTRDNSGWSFVARPQALSIPRPPSSDNGDPNAPTNALAGAALHLVLVVELPGSPGDSNASSVTSTATSTQFTWTLDIDANNLPARGGLGSLRASTVFVADQGSVPLARGVSPLRGVGAIPTDTGSAGARLAIALSVLAVLVGIGYLIARRQRRRRPDYLTT